jgi:hypothetical protein
MNALSSPDVAARYNIPLRTVQAACSNGTLTATKFGRQWMIDAVDAEAFAEAWKPTARNGHESHAHAIYRCFDPAGQLLYIGTCMDMAITLDEHWQVAEIRLENGYRTPEAAAAAQISAILTENPLLIDGETLMEDVDDADGVVPGVPGEAAGEMELDAASVDVVAP